MTAYLPVFKARVSYISWRTPRVRFGPLCTYDYFHSHEIFKKGEKSWPLTFAFATRLASPSEWCCVVWLLILRQGKSWSLDSGFVHWHFAKITCKIKALTFKNGLFDVVLYLYSHIKEHLKEQMGMDDEEATKYLNVSIYVDVKNGGVIRIIIIHWTH